MSCNFRWAIAGSASALLCLLSSFWPPALSQQIPDQARTQIRRQAAFAATQPAKVRLKMLTQDVVAGTNPRFEITLLNASNQPVAATSDLDCEISVHFASGKSASQTISIKQGQASTESAFPARETGLTAIVARPSSSAIRPEKVQVIVRPAPKSHTKQLHHGASAFPVVWDHADFSTRPKERSSSLFKPASFVSPLEGLNPALPQPQAAASSVSILHISLSDPNGNYRANGKDAAVISVVFESPDLSPARGDIHVWFHWTNGSLSPPQPLVIKKGAFSSDAQLTSVWPGDVRLTFVSSTPPYQAQGDTDSTIHFIPPGAALVGPDKLSLVDSTPIMIVFYDAQQNPISPGKDWAVTLHSSNSRLHFAPQSFDVQASSPVGSSSLFPVSWGNDTVEAVVADYTIQPLRIAISGWLVVGLCLGGGVAGGLAAYNKFKDSWMWRVFIGVLGGAVLCWLYVYLALPNVNANVAHNTFSVLFVALIGGYLGTTALDLAAKQLGLLGTDGKGSTPTG
jgi:hypothetical protein